MALCEVCSKLTLESLATEGAAGSVGVQVASDFLELQSRSKQCELCGLLYRSFVAVGVDPENPRKGAVKLSGVPSISQKELPASLAHLSGVLVSLHGVSTTLNLCTADTAKVPIAGRLVNSEIDMDGIAQFVHARIEKCKGEGHARCRQTFNGRDWDTEYLPPRLWNVKTKRLVDTRKTNVDDKRWVALSYLWGSSGIVHGVKTNKDDLPDRLEGIQPKGAWPATYQKAFEITLACGLEYIWIDSLCIVQDDGDDAKENFNNHVHRIYQNAEFTLCAVFDGAEKDPLPDRKVSEAKDRVRIDNGDYWITSRPGYPAIDIGGEGLPNPPKWATRGWTLQERTMPAKCLFLTEHQLYWECRQGKYEEGGMSHFPIVYKNAPFGQDRETQTFSFWPAIIRDFTSRTLGYYEDKVPAVLGIGKQIQDGQHDPFLEYGFLQNRLSRDLLWECSGSIPAFPVLTKVVLVKGHLPKVPVPHSWTWAFWNGPIGFDTYVESSVPADSTTYQIAPDSRLQVSHAKVCKLRRGPKIGNNGKIHATDIPCSVNHRNVYNLADDGQSAKGWVALDRDPDVGGLPPQMDSELYCLLVSTTTDDGVTSANVIVLIQVGSDYGRVGAGQVWDSTLAEWEAHPDPLLIASPEDLKPPPEEPKN